MLHSIFILTIFFLTLVTVFPYKAIFATSFGKTTVFNSDKTFWGWEGNGYILLWWKPLGKEVLYQVVRRSLEDGTIVILNKNPISTTSFVESSSELKGDYEFYLRVLDTSGKLLHETSSIVITDINHYTDDNSFSLFHFAKEVKEHIISDQEFRNNASMTLKDIEDFFHTRNSFLSDFETEDHLGYRKTASEIIFNASNKYSINPQVILTTLQKEQGLISTPLGEATQYQLDWSMGYALGNEEYRGFGKQIEGAAWQFDKYYKDLDTKGETVSGWKVNVPKETEDCVIITPANMATAGLYTYTPFAGKNWGGCTSFGGNFLFWDLFYNVYRFDAGPKGDFETVEDIGCSIALSPHPTHLVTIILLLSIMLVPILRRFARRMFFYRFFK